MRSKNIRICSSMFFLNQEINPVTTSNPESKSKPKWLETICNKESKKLLVMSKSFYFWSGHSKVNKSKRTFSCGLSHIFTFSLIYYHSLITLIPFIFYLIYLNGKKHNNFHNSWVSKFLLIYNCMFILS